MARALAVILAAGAVALVVVFVSRTTKSVKDGAGAVNPPLSKSIESPITGGIPSQKTISLYADQVTERKALLKEVLQQKDREYKALYNLIVPEVFCGDLVRVGQVNDGGKWTCNPFNAPKDCVVLSLGLNNEVSFETQFQQITNMRCRIIGVDMDRQRESVLKTFETINAKAYVGKITPVTKVEKREFKIDDILNKENEQTVELLKIDIEGAEFTTLVDFLTNYRVAQIFIEVHGGPAKMASLLVDISKLGYWLLSYEINGAHHRLSEFSFIHESAFEKYGATPLARYLDV